jgi:WD40 repeat protein
MLFLVGESPGNTPRLTDIDFNDKTADFYSGPQDKLILPNPGSITFSMASFHTKSIIAIGLEGGRILINQTNSDATFSTPYLYIDAHTNAVMDLDISEDDSMIASASGDKLAMIIDVRTRRPKAKFEFDQDGGTVKQIRFQPGNPNVVATTCREGFINIWDMRCHGKLRSDVKDVPAPEKAGPLELSNDRTAYSAYTMPFLSIANAHGDRSSLLAAGSHLTL